MGLGKRLSAAWKTLKGGGIADLAAEADQAAGRERLRLDLRGRDEEIATLRREYVLREEQARAEVARAGSESMLSLGKRLGPLLSQLATMESMAGEGKEMQARDVLILFGKVEKALAEAGLQPIGKVGETSAFDSRIHQRISGEDVDEGDPVRIRFIGYQIGGAVVTRAMVSRIGKGKGGG